MSTRKAYVWRWEEGSGGKRRLDRLAVEEPLEIRVDTQSISITMRTPGHDAELAVGFLLSEGLIRRRKDVADVRHYSRNREKNVIDVFLGPGVTIDFERLKRHVFMSSSCGLCGKASLDAVRQEFAPVTAGPRFRTKVLAKMPSQLLEQQEAFEQTGGLHAAGLFDTKGNLLVLREDVGRHNAVDKVLGNSFMEGRFPLKKQAILVSGRVSFEIMQKALAARVPLVAAVSAPSSLAVEFARESKQTLIGFLRDGRMNVYAGKERISDLMG